MACFKPITGYRNNLGQITFYDKGKGEPITVPCSQCLGCRIDKAKEWAVRCVHEASLHEDNCFITLTYSPEHLPPDGGLIKSHFQNFNKQLRHAITRGSKKINTDNIICPSKKYKFYMCGEYGDRNNRPHYHAILFGVNFNDWVYLFDSPGGEHIYTSPTLEQIWGKGFVTIGTVTMESAGYVARYCMKKLGGKAADEIDWKTGLKHYERYNDYTGEIHEVLPEYSTMSRGGRTGNGIGHGWISKFKSDCYPKDYTSVNGMRVKPPKAYDRYLKSIDPEMYDDIKAGRTLKAYESEEGTESRLKQREIVKGSQIKQLKRSL